MARIVLVTGGCRSGKSAYAQQMAESLPPTRLYVATCPVTDDEMQRRIELHRQARRDRGWETLEEQTDLAGVFCRYDKHNVLLVDCVTLWINNLMYEASRESRQARDCPNFRTSENGTVPLAPQLTESDVAERCGRMLEAAEACRGTVIFVTNEVGLGVVPDNALARNYRDLIGRANQTIAARADAVTLLCCGIPLHLKERNS